MNLAITFPIEEVQNGKPFILSGKKTYYIGNSNLKPQGFGNHIKGEMNGLWFPPLRILKWITVKNNEEYLAPESVLINYTSRAFKFKEFKLSLLSSGGKYFQIALEKLFQTMKPVQLVLEIGILPAWFSERVVDYSISSDGKAIVIREKNYDLQAVITSNNDERFVFNKDRVTFNVSNSTTINVTVMRSDEIYVSERNSGQEISEYGSKFVKYLMEKTRLDGENPIADAFQLASLNLHWLYLEIDNIGSGIVAGYPDFPWFFGIDTYYNSRGLLICGMLSEYENTLKILENYSKTQNGRIPHEIVSNGRVYNNGNLVESLAYPSMIWNMYEYAGNS